MAPAKDEVILGVDLGTTNSAVAVFRDDCVEVLTNDIDKRTTPSCVYVRDSERQVGEAALRLAASFPAYTVRNVKSILGRPSVPKGEAPLGPVATGHASMGKAVTIKIKNTEGGKVYSPEEIVAMLLLELKKAAEQQLQTEVHQAVLAVPSYFNASQRRAVKDAAELAGLHVPYMLNETTAAAMAYAFDREDEKTVLMVDVGGGGSSAAVVKVALNQVEVVAHSGVRLPGGEDFDARMMQFLTQCVKRELQAEALDPRDCEILRTQWTKAKEKLSRIPQASINVFLPGVGKEFSCDLKRAAFETECAELFKSITDGLLATLKRAKVEPEKLGEVLLVGGSSRIPHLRNLVQQVLKDKALCKAINPDEAVAKGAALMAAKRVQVKQEVLSLQTRIRMGKDVAVVATNTKLPYFINPITDTDIEVHQEIGTGNTMIRIFAGKLIRARMIGIFPSGLVKIKDLSNAEMPFLLDGCQPTRYIEFLRKNMQTHKDDEAVESRRVEGKNDLEDLLRCVRSTEIPNDKFQETSVELRTFCEERLEWLNDNGNRPFAEYNNIRIKVEEAWTDLKAKRETERTRVEVRERVSEALLGIQARFQVSDDFFRSRVDKLHNRCKDKLSWIQDNPDASGEKYSGILDCLSTAADGLQDDMDRRASDQRKTEARKAFEERVAEVSLPTKERPDNALFSSYCDSLKKLCQDASAWLHGAGCSEADERQLAERRQAFDAQEAEITHKFKCDQDAAERSRLEAFKAVEKEVLQVLHVKVSVEHPLFELTNASKNYCHEKLTWLQKNPNASEEQLNKLRAKITHWERTMAVEDERMDLLLTLEKRLMDGIKEFNNDPLLIDLERECRVKLLDHRTRPPRQYLRNALSAVTDILDHLRHCRDHRMKQQEEARAADAAYQQAIDRATKFFSELRFEEQPPQAAEETLSSGATGTPTAPLGDSGLAQYQPMDFTSAAPDADNMEVDSERPVHAGNGHVNGRGSEPMVESEAALHPREGPQQGTVLGGHQSTHPQHVNLQSPANELAREALEGARAAGSMALLVDREASADHDDLISLSIRFVRDSGDAVELLLLVRDATNFKGSADEFVRGTWARFEDLCNSVTLDWYRCLNYLSARDCGPFGPAFVKLFSEKMGSDRKVVVSTSVPLDRRVALACYERAVSSSSRAEADILENFFSTVDSFRRALPRGCRCELPGRSCSCPFPTYTSSIAFLLENREAMASAPEAVLESVHCGPLEIDFKMSMNNAGFLVCLAAFGEVFSELCPFSNGLSNSALSMGGYWTVLCDLRRLLVSDDFKKRVITAARQVSSSGNVQNLVRVIIEVANTVVTAARHDFKHCHEILQCLVSEDCKPRGYFGNDAHAELESLRSLHPTAMFDSPEHVLGMMRRSEFRKRYPSLYSALQRALTAPFLPPSGPRSAEQLRKGALWAAGVPGHQVEARVIVGGRAPVGVPLSFEPGF